MKTKVQTTNRNSKSNAQLALEAKAVERRKT
jgi:hypothetical protein